MFERRVGMTEDTVVNITMATVWLILKVSAPILLVSLIVGLLISIFQTVTSIQDQTLTFVPKILAVFITLMLCGGWIMQKCVSFLQEITKSFSNYLHLKIFSLMNLAMFIFPIVVRTRSLLPTRNLT